MHGEDDHESLSLDEGLHKRCIFTFVVAIIPRAITVIALLSDGLFVQTWICSTTVVCALEGKCRMDWDMNESYAWNGSAVLLAKSAVGGTEPIDHLNCQQMSDSIPS